MRGYPLTIVLRVGACLVLFAATSITASAADPKPGDLEFFETKIRPVLVKHCYKCHAADAKKVQGKLLLDTRAGIRLGGESGAAVTPGNPKKSLILSALRHDDLEMPPKNKLPAAIIADFEKWIRSGAADPRDGEVKRTASTIDIEAGRKFWAFQLPRKTPPPKVTATAWSESAIDRYVLARLEARDLKPVADADRQTLIRRAYVTLIGLPPTPEQIDAFLQDKSPLPEALAKVIDHLFASKHFGERWGRHWLDVMRFAESSGGGRSLMFKDAWRFRDYVIQSFNADKPIRQMIREQIAGDLLPYDSPQQRAEQLVATGFLALGPTNYEQQNKALLRMEVIDEQVDTVGRAFLGLTLGCARCHDHKFDPIPIRDYYAMAGIFGSTQSLVPGNVSNPVMQPLPASGSDAVAQQAHAKKIAAMSKQLAAARAQFVVLGGKPAVPSKNSSRRKVLAADLPGIVIDNGQAKLVGQWKPSTFSPLHVGANYIHDDNRGQGTKSVVFSPKVPTGGMYEVRISYAPGGNRASNVPVTIDHQDGRAMLTVNQSQPPPIDGIFVSLGRFRFEADNVATITVSNRGANGHVIVDAVQLISDRVASELAKKNRPKKSGNKKQKNVPAKKKENAAGSQQLAQAAALVKTLDRQLAALKKNAPKSTSKGVAMSVKDVSKPVDGHVHIRGSFDNLGPVIPRGFLTVAMPATAKPPKIKSNQSGRVELADWIASENNPLTARVYVNRVWRHLFGTGLVPTPDNHGTMGRRPTHPKLLDHLAIQFVEDGWSTKRLIRRIMLSHVYRLSTQRDDKAFKADDLNQLLWRASRRRLDAEVIRDSILSVSGQLDLTPGGRTIRKISQYDLSYKFDTVRRSVYVPAFRNSILELFEVFDLANPNLVVGHRNTSTLPTQALYLMNSPFVIDQSRHAAKRLLAEKIADDARVTLAYRRTLGRPPTKDELTLVLGYLKNFKPDDASVDDSLEAWASFCHSLFACVDFRYID
jgi:hypothetical protein